MEGPRPAVPLWPRALLPVPSGGASHSRFVHRAPRRQTEGVRAPGIRGHGPPRPCVCPGSRGSSGRRQGKSCGCAWRRSSSWSWGTGSVQSWAASLVASALVSARLTARGWGWGSRGTGGGGQGASPPRGDSQAPALAAFVRKILQVSRAAGLLWLRQRLRVPRPAGASVSFAQSSSVWARHGLWAADARPPSCLGCWFPRKPPPCPMFAAQSGREGPGPALPAEGLSSARAPPPAEPGRQGLGGGLFPALSCVGSSRSFECVRKTPKETPSGRGLGRPLDGRGSGPPVPAPGVQGGRLAPLSSEAASGPWPPCQALPYRGTLPGSHGPRRFL